MNPCAAILATILITVIVIGFHALLGNIVYSTSSATGLPVWVDAVAHLRPAGR